MAPDAFEGMLSKMVYSVEELTTAGSVDESPLLATTAGEPHPS